MKADIEQWSFVDPTLRAIAVELERRTGMEFTLTSPVRLPLGGPSLHQNLPLRAIDLRCRDEAFGKFIEGWINTRWQYDHERPEKQVCLFHDTGQGYHLHLQVHPNTVIRL